MNVMQFNEAVEEIQKLHVNVDVVTIEGREFKVPAPTKNVLWSKKEKARYEDLYRQICKESVGEYIEMRQEFLLSIGEDPCKALKRAQMSGQKRFGREAFDAYRLGGSDA